MLTQQPVDARLSRLRVGLGRHASAEGRQLLVGFGRHTPQRFVIGGGTGGVNQPAIEVAKALQQSVSLPAAQILRARSRGIQLTDDLVEGLVNRPIGAAASRDEPRHDPVEMGGERLPRASAAKLLPGIPVRAGCRPDTDGTAPFVECIQDVRFAELDPDGTSARSFRVVALDVSIDASEDCLERNALRCPLAHLLESGPDDPNQVSVVFPAQIGFDLPAVLVRAVVHASRFSVLGSCSRSHRVVDGMFCRTETER